MHAYETKTHSDMLNENNWGHLLIVHIFSEIFHGAINGTLSISDQLKEK